jgi:hypothetical protein
VNQAYGKAVSRNHHFSLPLRTARTSWLLFLLPCLLFLHLPARAQDEPEEPDYAFVAGGPYTQQKNSLQLIAPGMVGWRTSGAGLNRRFYDAMLRVEWGFTPNIELDLEISATGLRERTPGTTLSSDFGLSDTVLGVRYRLLNEEDSPITLALGPQIIFPSGNILQGTGFDSFGFAWDIAVAKDWGGPFFVYSSLNYAVIPSVSIPGVAGDFTLNQLTHGSALGIRALEKPSGGAHHDIHAFLEVGIERGEEVTATGLGAIKTSSTAAIFSPGIRYGFLSASKKLIEIGVAFPIGLNDNAPRASIIFQIQFEQFLNF